VGFSPVSTIDPESESESESESSSGTSWSTEVSMTMFWILEWMKSQTSSSTFTSVPKARKTLLRITLA